MPQKVILDVDTGGDDAVAILLAGHHPATELAAITVTHGNAPLSVTLSNTLKCVEHGNLARMPVYSGAQRPFIAEPAPLDPVQNRALPLPTPTLAPQPGHAVDFLIDYYLGPSGPDTILVPPAPQTNIALALLKEPRLAKRIPRIVTMAGAYLEGNVTPSAEFNVYADPEAARIVFNSGIPITMVGLEVTAQALVTLDDAAKLKALGTPQAKVAAEEIRHEVQWFVDNLDWSGGQIYDACAVAAVIEPGILQTKPMHVDIELRGELTRGRTVADITGYQKKTPNVDVGVGIDRERFMQILFEGMR
jgi:inosine-uridine nucleoside N-ribohydrolase